MSECPICQKRKALIIENWVGLDKIIFRGYSPTKVLENDINDYRKLKSSLLFNLYEIYSEIGHISYRSYDNIKELNKIMTEVSNEIFNQSKEIITENSDIDVSNKKQLIENIFRTSIDLLVFNEVDESLSNLIQSEKGRLLIQAHRNFRDKLVKFATERI